MKAVVFHGIGDVRLDSVAEPEILYATDAIIRLTSSAICGTDLHMVRGTMPGMKPGTILGHEGVGVVEAVGRGIRNLRPGDRVVVPSTIGCGNCSYCRSGYSAQCDDANPNGSSAGTAFFGGPESTGPFHGLQAEFARIPYAHHNLIRLPKEVSDDQAILLSDIYPTGYFGAELAEVTEGDVVAVWGCGPVGLFAILSAFQQGAHRVIAIDGHADRLERAQAFGAEAINFNHEDPLAAIAELTRGIGPDRAVDAVGVDAERPKPAAARAEDAAAEEGGLWKPGDGPDQVLNWAVQSLAKAGSLGVIGVYPQGAREFPIGTAMNKNLTVKMGNCNHRSYIPRLVEKVRNGSVDPTLVLTQVEPLFDVIDAYRQFDLRHAGWIKVGLQVPR